MTFLSIVIVSLVCVVISYIVLNYRRWLYVKTRKPLQGPKPLPFIGNAHLFLTNDGFLNTILKLTDDYLSPIQCWFGNKLYFLIYEPDQIKTLLRNNHCLDKSEMYKIFKPALGTGLVTAPASKWIHNRKIFEPGFNKNMLRNFFDTFVEQSLLFTEELEKVGLNGNEINLYEDIIRCTVNIAFNNLTGSKLIQSDILSVIVETITRFKEIFRYRIGNIIMYPDIIFNLTALGRQQRNYLNNVIYPIIDEVIKQRMNALNPDANKTKGHKDFTIIKLKGNNQQLFISFSLYKIDKTFFDIFMEATHGKQYYDETITLVMGASETIAIAMNFVIFMLANFPEIQEKVYKELSGIYNMETPKSALVKYEDLQNMHYLERVIKETMRIFPPVPVVGRQLKEDIKIGEYILPKGANIIVVLLKLHRNEKYWPNPMIFDPDRFLPENLPENYGLYYMPFSSGPRNCIGTKYAMMAMKVILANLIRTFVFKVDERIEIDKIKLDSDLILYTLQPLKVKIEKRYLQ